MITATTNTPPHHAPLAADCSRRSSHGQKSTRVCVSYLNFHRPPKDRDMEQHGRAPDADRQEAPDREPRIPHDPAVAGMNGQEDTANPAGVTAPTLDQRIARLELEVAAAEEAETGDMTGATPTATPIREDDGLDRVQKRAKEVRDIICRMIGGDPETRIVDVSRACTQLGYSMDETAYGINDVMNSGPLTQLCDSTALPRAEHTRTPTGGRNDGSRSGLTDILPALDVGQARTRLWVQEVVPITPTGSSLPHSPTPRDGGDSPTSTPGSPSLASTPKRPAEPRERISERDHLQEDEILRGSTTGGPDLNPDTIGSRSAGSSANRQRTGNDVSGGGGSGNNNNGDNNNNNKGRAEEESDLSSVFGSPNASQEAAASSTPRDKDRTKSNWDDSDAEGDSSFRDRSKGRHEGETKEERKR